MGTSSSYNGPTGPPLLPPWAEPLPPEYPLPNDPLLPSPLPPDGEGQDGDGQDSDGGTSVACPGPAPLDPESAPAAPSPSPPSWGTAKRSLTSYSKQSDGRNPRTVVRNYVRSHGGPRQAAHSASAGRAMTSSLGGFLSDVRARGFAAAVRGLVGRDLVGRDPMCALAALIDAIAPDGALRDESAARLAAIETLTALGERYDVINQGIEAIGGITEEVAREMVALSISTFVNAQFQEELILRVEAGNFSEAQANRIASEIREFILEDTLLKLAQNTLTLDLQSPQGRDLTRQLYENAFSFLETSE